MSLNSDQSPPNPPIITTRVFDASSEAIFGAISNPDVLAKWWGPQGFTNTFTQFDFRPGGTWHVIMQTNDGTKYEVTYKILEIDEPKLIRLRNPQSGHEFELAMILTEEAGKTRLTWNMQFESPEEAERVRSFVSEANEQNLDRLADYLATTAA